MPGPARQFKPQITRSGGTPSKYRFTARCSGCPKVDSYEANRVVDDNLVKSYFKDRGWLLGRDRSYDLCPACLAKPREPQPPRPLQEARRQRLLEPASHSDRLTAPADNRSRDTADILARHLGKPEALAAEVFRPEPVQTPRLSAPPQQAPSVPALSPEVEQALIGMAAEMKSLRSSMELMAEQVSKLVALGSQQIEAIARLTPLVVQSAEGISGGLREVAEVVRAIPSSAPPAVEALKPAAKAIKAEEQPALQPELAKELDQAINSEANPGPATDETRKPSKPSRPSKKNEARAKPPKEASAPVVVKSIPDAKRSDRFYTTIRLPRELWNSAGFGSEDRLLINWTGKILTISRAAEGGVKPKTIGDVTVVLQSWKLGNLNIDQPKVTEGDTSLRLIARP